MNRYEENRVVLTQRVKRLFGTSLNLDMLADIECYKECEKRGFYVWLKGIEIQVFELEQYARRIMVEKESPVWVRIERPKLGQRFRGESHG